MKIKKAFNLLICVSLLSITQVNAATNSESEVYARKCPVEQYYEEIYSNDYYKLDSRGNEARNDTSTAQEVSIELSRTISLDISGAAKTELNIMMHTVGVSAEISVAGSASRKVTRKVNVAPHSVTYLDYGSRYYSTSGYIVTVNSDCSQTKKKVSATYTYGEYTHWY